MMPRMVSPALSMLGFRLANEVERAQAMTAFVFVQNPTRRKITDTTQIQNPACKTVGEESPGTWRKIRNGGSCPSLAGGTSHMPMANRIVVRSQPMMIQPMLRLMIFVRARIRNAVAMIHETSGISQARLVAFSAAISRLHKPN